MIVNIPTLTLLILFDIKYVQLQIPLNLSNTLISNKHRNKLSSLYNMQEFEIPFRNNRHASVVVTSLSCHYIVRVRNQPRGFCSRIIGGTLLLIVRQRTTRGELRTQRTQRFPKVTYTRVGHTRCIHLGRVVYIPQRLTRIS